MKKTLYLHIGFSKTGTSFIQSSLAFNRKRLKSCGIYYPAMFEYSLSKYGLINSGNGAVLAKLLNPNVMPLQQVAITPGKAWAFLEKDILSTKADRILLSSEGLQAAQKENLKELKIFLDKNDIELRVVAFARSFLEHAFSRWMQGIKRSGGVGEWEKVVSRYRAPFLKMLDTYCEVFGAEAIKVYSYDLHARHLIKTVAQFLDIPGLQPCPVSDVNRSLSLKEIAMMLFINKLSADLAPGKAAAISTAVSDLMVEIDQDTPAREIKQSKKAWESFVENNTKTCDDLNKKYLPGEPVQLSVNPPQFGELSLPELSLEEKQLLTAIHSYLANKNEGALLQPEMLAGLDKASIYILGSRVFIKQKKVENALWAAGRAVDKVPGEPRAYLELARSYEALNNFKAAAAAMRKAISIWPEEVQYSNYLKQLNRKTVYSSAGLEKVFATGIILMDNTFYNKRIYQYIRSALRSIKKGIGF